MVLARLVVLSVLSITAGCGAGAKVCAVVDVAHHACTVIRYLAPDGTVREVKVPTQELEALARETAIQNPAAVIR